MAIGKCMICKEERELIKEFPACESCVRSVIEYIVRYGIAFVPRNVMF
jgi:hypothetical protein